MKYWMQNIQHHLTCHLLSITQPWKCLWWFHFPFWPTLDPDQTIYKHSLYSNPDEMITQECLLIAVFKSKSIKSDKLKLYFANIANGSIMRMLMPWLRLCCRRRWLWGGWWPGKPLNYARGSPQPRHSVSSLSSIQWYHHDSRDTGVKFTVNR